jgi:AcrR family transcriptional regulator
MNRKGGSSKDLKTRERILDAAEKLFGELGYAATSIRALTRAARVNLGAVTYHFGGKEELYIEAFLRRARPVNERRLAELRALRATTPLPAALPLRSILRCLLRGPLEIAAERPEFVQLLSRTLLHPPSFVAPRLRRILDPLAGPFAEELARSLPDLPETILRFRLMLSGGSVHLLLCQWPNRTNESPLGALPSLPAESALEMLVDYCAAGISSAVRENSDKRTA